MTNTKTKIEIADIERLELIEIDPYRRDTCTAASVQIVIEPSEGRAYLETYSPGQGVHTDRWHGVDLTLPVETSGHVDGPELVEWLRDGDGQALLQRICAGHAVEWDGNNHVGELDDDAQEALDTLAYWLEHNAPTLDGEHAGLWQAEDWLDGSTDLPITAETTDAEISALADRLTEEATETDAVVVGVYTFLIEMRDDLAEND